MSERHSIDRRTFCGIVLSSLLPAAAAEAAPVTFCCSSTNDVYAALRGAGVKVQRFDTPSEAMARAAPRSGVLLLSDAYPERKLSLPPGFREHAAGRKLRVYVEYAAQAGHAAPAPATAEWERAVVCSDFFGAPLPIQRILSLHNCRYIPLSPGLARAKTHLMLARVAGYDTAVFGIPEKGTHPLLVEEDGVLTAATQLSRFVTARYAPAEAWTTAWRAILRWLCGSAEAPDLRAPRVVAPAWPPSVPLPGDAEHHAIVGGAQWYYNARLFIHPSWEKRVPEARRYPDQVGPPPSQDLPSGDGSLGMLEGHDARILPDGSQNMRWWTRADCIGETSMTLTMADRAASEARHRAMAANLIEFLLLRSHMASGSRMDPQSPSYGLIGWNNTPKYHNGEDGFDVYYGDDNARCLLGILATMAVTGESRWLERVWLAVLANFRLIGRQGHQKARYDQVPLAANGWRHYFDSDIVLHDMNYEAYPWALFLWAATKTDWPILRERVERGIRVTMEAYPSQWRWSNSITSQQARILLPLAWLVRIRDTAETRGWLRRIATDLLSHQHASGAIREWTGSRGTGLQMPPASNERYGTGEGTLIQTNGDPATDLLYTMNFAFIGLHEAFAATGERRYKDAENRIADFLLRAQARSKEHPEFDGAWFRAFDFEKWDYWASSSDSGWGAWCTESGWSQSWITTTFALRTLNRSLWDVLAAVPDFTTFDRLRESMFGAADNN